MMEDDDGAVAGRITVRQKGFKDQVVEFDLGPGEAEGLPWESKLQAGKESDCKVVVEFKRSQKWPGCPWPAPKQKTVVPDCKDGEVEFFREDCSLKAN